MSAARGRARAWRSRALLGAFPHDVLTLRASCVCCDVAGVDRRDIYGRRARGDRGRARGKAILRARIHRRSRRADARRAACATLARAALFSPGHIYATVYPGSTPGRVASGRARARDLPLPNSKTFFDPFFSSDSRRRRRALPVVGSRAGGQRACVVYRARSPATARGACAPRSPRIRAIRVGIPRNTSRDGARIAAEDQN